MDEVMNEDKKTSRALGRSFLKRGGQKKRKNEDSNIYETVNETLSESKENGGEGEA